VPQILIFTSRKIESVYFSFLCFAAVGRMTGRPPGWVLVVRNGFFFKARK